MCIYVSMSVEARGQLWLSFLRCCPLCFLKQASLLQPGAYPSRLARLVSKLRGPTGLALLSSGITIMQHHLILFYKGSGALNMSPCACKARGLLPGLSFPMPHFSNLIVLKCQQRNCFVIVFKLHVNLFFFLFLSVAVGLCLVHCKDLSLLLV